MRDGPRGSSLERGAVVSVTAWRFRFASFWPVVISGSSVAVFNSSVDQPIGFLLGPGYMVTILWSPKSPCRHLQPTHLANSMVRRNIRHRIRLVFTPPWTASRLWPTEGGLVTSVDIFVQHGHDEPINTLQIQGLRGAWQPPSRHYAEVRGSSVGLSAAENLNLLSWLLAIVVSF